MFTGCWHEFARQRDSCRRAFRGAHESNETALQNEFSSYRAACKGARRKSALRRPTFGGHHIPAAPRSACYRRKGDSGKSGFEPAKRVIELVGILEG